MELGAHKASKCAPEDIISTMPDDVMTNIMDRLPLQDAVKTRILTRKWRFKWTLLTQLIFDFKLFEYLLGRDVDNNYNGRNLSRLLPHLKGPMTKLVLDIDDKMLNHQILDYEDVNHWVLFVSRKGIKELKLNYNTHRDPRKLPTHVYSCTKLEILKLRSCVFHHLPTFHGFPNLFSLDLWFVTIDICIFREFIVRCPLLETLKIMEYGTIDETKLVEIAKLRNLKMLSLTLYSVHNLMMVKKLSIFELMSLPKLQELNMNFWRFKLLAEAGAIKRFLRPLSVLRLELSHIDFGSDTLLLLVYEVICGSPNLQTLNITFTYNDKVPVPPRQLCSLLDCNTRRQLQLCQVVFILNFRSWENELRLIKYLLARSPFAKEDFYYTSILKEKISSRLKNESKNEL